MGVRRGGPRDADLLLEEQPADEDLLDHRDDRRLAFLADLRHLVDEPVDGNVLDPCVPPRQLLVDLLVAGAGPDGDPYLAGLTHPAADVEPLRVQPQHLVDRALIPQVAHDVDRRDARDAGMEGQAQPAIHSSLRS